MFKAPETWVSLHFIDSVNGVFTYTRRDVWLSGAAYSIRVSTDLLEWIEDTEERTQIF
jgi:hypothetical protein